LEKHLPNFLAFIAFIVSLGILSGLSSLVRPNTLERTAKTAKLPSAKQSLRFELTLSLTVVFFLGFIMLLPAAMSLKSKLSEDGHFGALIATGTFLAILSIGIAYSRKKGEVNEINGST
jgi:NADH:ubiquinone oxidoreductase subunit 3 (subunit A)